MSNELRKTELSGKFVQMGQSLMEEGLTLKDYSITQSGNIMIILAAVIMSEEDSLIFSEMCAMFSAKKILMDSEGIDSQALINLLKKRKAELKPKTRRRGGNKDSNI
jgi:hypothetical protein